MRSTYVLASVLAALIVMPFTPRANAAVELPPWSWHAGQWQIAARTSHFKSDANYDETRGSFERLTGDNSFTVLDFGLRARYSLNSRLSLYGGGDFAQAASRDAQVDRTNSAITDVYVGGDYVVTRKWVRLIAELEGLFSLDPIDIDTTDTLTNDGVHHVRASLFALKPLRLLRMYGHAGIKYRDEGLAGLLMWGVGAEKPFSQRYLIGAGLEGFEAVIDDELSQTRRTAVTARVNAGSQTFYAYNPALLEARAWLGWNPTNAWQLKIGYARSLDGLRSAAGQSVFLSGAYNFGLKARETLSNPPARRDAIRKKSRRAVETFEVEPDKTDPDLFDQDDDFEPDTEADPLAN